MDAPERTDAIAAWTAILLELVQRATGDIALPRIS
jgi:hypothetical protein